jgi:hypothetical protein
MILPTKHIEAGRSIIGVGAALLSHLDHPWTITALWEKVRQLPQIGTFERFTLAIDFLYMIDAVEFNNGLLQRRSK